MHHIQFKTEGPFFTHDPKKTFRQNIRLMLDGVAAEGEAAVIAAMMSGEGQRQELYAAIPRRTSAHIKGRVNNWDGQRWAVTAVVGVVNQGMTAKEAVSLMAGASRVESQSGPVHKVYLAMRRNRAVQTAELLKGLV